MTGMGRPKEPILSYRQERERGLECGPTITVCLDGMGSEGRGVMDTQEGADQGRKQLGCWQKSVLGFRPRWIPHRAPPGVTQPLPLFVPRCSPSSIVKTKGSPLACAGAGNLVRWHRAWWRW